MYWARGDRATEASKHRRTMIESAIAMGALPETIAKLEENAPQDDIELDADGNFGVWKENWEAVMLFANVSDRWTFAGFSGQPVAFDIVAARAIWSDLKLKVTSKHVAQVLDVARAALTEWIKVLAVDSKRERARA